MFVLYIEEEKYMKEIYDVKELYGNFFSPISVIVSIGLIGISIGVCREMFFDRFSKRFFIGR